MKCFVFFSIQYSIAVLNCLKCEAEANCKERKINCRKEINVLNLRSGPGHKYYSGSWSDWPKTIPTQFFTLLIRLVRDRLLGPILSEKHNKGCIQSSENFRMCRNHWRLRKIAMNHMRMTNLIKGKNWSKICVTTKSQNIQKIYTNYGTLNTYNLLYGKYYGHWQVTFINSRELWKDWLENICL